MTLYIIYGMLALVACVFALALVSDGFAYSVSRLVEAAFDFVEYKMALRAQREAA